MIDYRASAERNRKSYDPAQPIGITYEELMECLAEQERVSGRPIELQKGDILLIRSGFTRRYLEFSDEEERTMAHRYPPVACGVTQDVRMLRFLWDKQVAVVGGDAPGSCGGIAVSRSPAGWMGMSDWRTALVGRFGAGMRRAEEVDVFCCFGAVECLWGCC